jgi:predicted dehydrogenase
MTREYGVGILGCGNISAAYFKLIPLYNNIRAVACADINMAAAEARAAEFGVEAQSIEAMLANPAVDVIVNLTIPEAHFEVSKRVLEAGKHVYSEKPFVLSIAEGEELRRIADARGLRVGSAPDTFMGGAHQFARKLIEEGKVGKIMSGTAHVLGAGMEAWHPNPDFFFRPGAGPILDMGPYYVTNLVNLVGPVKRVTAMANMARSERVIGNGPRNGEAVKVTTPTNIHAILEFESGAEISLMASWDVIAHKHTNMELYGVDGSLLVPDPNFFGGELQMAQRGGDGFQPVELWDHPLTQARFQTQDGRMLANYRAAGLSDMMASFGEGREHRCSLDRALHVVDVLTSILKSAEEKRYVDIQTKCTQPAPFGIDDAAALMRSA